MRRIGHLICSSVGKETTEDADDETMLERVNSSVRRNGTMETTEMIATT